MLNVSSHFCNKANGGDHTPKRWVTEQPIRRRQGEYDRYTMEVPCGLTVRYNGRFWGNDETIISCGKNRLKRKSKPQKKNLKVF